MHRHCINKALEHATQFLRKLSRNAASGPQEILHIATSSANGDRRIGKNILHAVNKVGKYGVIKVEASSKFDDYISIVDGYNFHHGFISEFFVGPVEGGIVDYKDCLMLFYADKVQKLETIQAAVELANVKKRPLIIIACDYSPIAVSELIMSKCKYRLKVMAVRAPAVGDQQLGLLEDMAVLTGGVVFGKENGSVKDIMFDDFGRVEKIVMTKKKTVFFKGQGRGKERLERADQLLQLARASPRGNSAFEERYGKFTAGIATIHVGGRTHAEMERRKGVAAKAVEKTWAALMGGVLPGGGVALLRSSQSLGALEPRNRDQQVGIDVVSAALKAPCMAILENAAGKEAFEIINMVGASDDMVGYDVMLNTYVDMLQAGLFDPTKVVCAALKEAPAITRIFTDATI